MFSSRLAQWREGRRVQQVSQPKQARQRTMQGKVRLCLVGLAGCVICAAAWALVIQSGPVLAKKGGNGGGNGGGGGGDGGGETQPLEVTGCVTFRDGEEMSDFDGNVIFPADAVQSDGAGPYCDAEITLMVDKWGVKPDWHRFNLHPYNKRDVWLDFSDPKQPGAAENDPPETGPFTLGEFSATEFIPRPNLLEMTPEATDVLRMVMTTKESATRKRYFIYFGDTTATDNLWSGSNSITVTAGPDTDNDGLADSWTFESTGAGSLVFIGKGNGSTYERKGVFNLPFAVTFTRD